LGDTSTFCWFSPQPGTYFRGKTLVEMGVAINVEELAQVLKISKTKSYELVKREDFSAAKLLGALHCYRRTITTIIFNF